MPADGGDRERAKLIIAEIIRQAGGSFRNKTNLYKAFYHAHLRFAETQSGYLSNWPIVKMPRGPGINDGSKLIAELVNEGILDLDDNVIDEEKGISAICFELIGEAKGELSTEAIEAIKLGVQQVAGKTAAQVSSDAYEVSRSSRDARDGEELNIYLDLIPEEEFARREEDLKRLSGVSDSVWSKS